MIKHKAGSLVYYFKDEYDYELAMTKPVGEKIEMAEIAICGDQILSLKIFNQSCLENLIDSSIHILESLALERSLN